MESVNFLGHECCSLRNAVLEILVTRSIGPRILSLRFKDGKNLFAEIPDVVTECPGAGTFHFYGGHRLWHAPEIPGRTYLPDDSPVDITPREKSLLVTQKTEPQTGLQKSIEILLSGDTRVVVNHLITNHGMWDVTCAPWAITQFKPRGTAILPQTRMDTGVLPNRSLTLWPYSDISSQHVQWGNNFIIVHARMDSPFKIGFPNPRGWLAYWTDGTLFVKHAEYQAQADYYDFGSSSECYCNDQFLELETLAPMTTITPGGTVSHVETWDLYRDIENPRDEKDVLLLARQLGLE